MQKEQELIRNAVGFFGQSNSTNVIQFKHEGNLYLLNTTAVGSSTQDNFAMQCFNYVCGLVKNGTECAEVVFTNATEFFNTAVCWTVETCGKQITLYRNASQSSHAEFEGCLKNSTVDSAAEFDHKCDHNQGGSAFSLTLIIVFSVTALLVIAGILWRISQRETYDSIEPAQPPQGDDENTGLRNRFAPGSSDGL